MRWGVLVALAGASAACNAVAGLDDLRFEGVPPGCGDGRAESPEECDGDVGVVSCTSLGYPGGVLACSADCRHDVSGCFVPTTPVLRFPANGAQLGSVHVPGSLRPRFSWTASTVEGGAPIVYELEHGADMELTSEVVVVRIDGTSHRPDADLATSATPPVGRRYYWRVRACAGTACSPFSATWYVDLGRSDRDFDGDGIAEMAIGAPIDAAGAGFVRVYSTATLEPMVDVFGQPGENLGIWVSSTDLDADGFADLLVGAPTSATGGRPGSVHVHYGGPSGLADAADLVIVGELPGDLFGYSVGAAGDANGDGFRDVVVGANLAGRPETGQAYLFFGGPRARMATTAATILHGETAGDNFGSWVASAGDVDGDGFADVLVDGNTNDAGGMDAGRAYVFRGASAPTSDPAAVMTGAAGDRLGRSLAGGDLDADGFSDIAVGAYQHAGVGRVYVLQGNPGLDVDLAAAAAIDPPMGHAVLGRSLAIGDVNGDGFEDLLAGAADRAFLYYGGVGELNGAMPAVTLAPADPNAPGDYGRAVALGSDVDGDGVGDVLVGAPSHAMDSGRVYVYLSARAWSDPLIIDAPAPGGLFGYAVR